MHSRKWPSICPSEDEEAVIRVPRNQRLALKSDSRFPAESVNHGFQLVPTFIDYPVKFASTVRRRRREKVA
jgi:hypothetical protein